MKSIAEFAVTRINQERKSPLMPSPVNKWSFVNAFRSDSWQTSSASSIFRVKRRANRKRLGLCGETKVVKAAWSPFRAAAKTSSVRFGLESIVAFMRRQKRTPLAKRISP
jgi:hypothetical protein